MLNFSHIKSALGALVMIGACIAADASLRPAHAAEPSRVAPQLAALGAQLDALTPGERAFEMRLLSNDRDVMVRLGRNARQLGATLTPGSASKAKACARVQSVYAMTGALEAGSNSLLTPLRTPIGNEVTEIRELASRLRNKICPSFWSTDDEVFAATSKILADIARLEIDAVAVGAFVDRRSINDIHAELLEDLRSSKKTESTRSSGTDSRVAGAQNGNVNPIR